MTREETAGPGGFHAWNPGLTSSIPEVLLPEVTLYRPEASSVDYRQAKEVADFVGLSPAEVIAFTTERLVVHELLIRVTVDFCIPDGPKYEDLGLHLRSMVETIHKSYVLPDLDRFTELHEAFRTRAGAWIDRELAPLYDVPVSRAVPEENPSFFARLFGAKLPPPSPPPARPEAFDLIADWNARLEGAEDAMERACLSALGRIVGKIVGARGKLVGDRQLVGELVTRAVCNEFVGVVLGDALEPYIRRAAEAEGYRRLPAQTRPVIMNVKGASASGKSTIRWDQKTLAGDLGFSWSDFAVISPDYWRKYFLEYESLGDDFKYGAMLTGQELTIVDRKLDQYLEAKAQANAIPHVLIDRFRFDTFNPAKDGADRPQTRFGEIVYMFFMVTAPEETVERAWVRGLTTGRYKAVDDLLFHNVEAYSGMPELFLTCARTAGKTLHYEFLDNNVPKGHSPRTIAFGWNGHMTVLDVRALLEIDRYRNIDIKARAPEELYGDDEDRPPPNGRFLNLCMSLLPKVTFVDPHAGRVFGQMEKGSWTWCDPGYRASDPAELEAIGWPDTPTDGADPSEEFDGTFEKHHTLGVW